MIGGLKTRSIPVFCNGFISRFVLVLVVAVVAAVSYCNRADESFETVSVDRIYIYMAMGRLRPKEGLISMKDLQVRSD